MTRKKYAGAVPECLCRGLQDEEQNLKITLELGKDSLMCLKERIGSSDVNAVTAFVRTAIRNEIERLEEIPPSRTALTAMAEEIAALRRGQRVLFMLIDRAAAIFSRRLTDRSPNAP